MKLIAAILFSFAFGRIAAQTLGGNTVYSFLDLPGTPQLTALGGIKEKVLAAKRAGLREIILCWQNEKDIQDIDSTFIKGLKFNFVKNMQQVLELALA